MYGNNCLCRCCWVSVCVFLSRGNGGRGCFSLVKNLFRIWSQSQPTPAQCHKGTFDGKEREKKRKRVVLGQSIGYPFKLEHSTGRFSKCQSHFRLWTDSLMDHSNESVGGLRRRRRLRMRGRGDGNQRQT